MNKLSKEFLSICTPENSCANELVVLPTDGDAGFEEYFEHKAQEVIKAKKIFSPKDQNKLMLEYPKPDSIEKMFNLFFESPIVVAKNHEFEGCFAVDISAYIGKTNHKDFERLMVYMHNYKEAVYLLFMYSDSDKEIQKMYNCLSSYDEIRVVNIPLPDAKALTDYTVDKIRAFSHVKGPVQTLLQDYYSQMKCGYDYADYLVRYLKSTGFEGDLSSMKEATEEAAAIWQTSSSDNSIGF